MFSRNSLLLAVLIVAFSTFAYGAGFIGVAGHYAPLDGYPTIVGTLNLNNSSMHETGLNKYAALKGFVGNAYNTGWSTGANVGITSGSAATSGVTGLAPATGQDYTAMSGNTVFFGRSFTATQSLVMYTWGGDANMDGYATTDDDDLWINGYYDQVANPTKNDYHWIQGDYNHDGYVTTDDSDLWIASYYTQVANPTVNYAPPAGVSAVPEPSVVVMLLAGVVSLLCIARKSRKG